MNDKTHVNIDDAVSAFSKWVEFKKNQRPKGNITPASIRQSALLVWLLQGNEVLEHPPPRLYSYPDHELACGGVERKVYAWETNGTSFQRLLGKDHMVVSQCGDWKIIERRDHGVYVVQWKISGDLYLLTPIEGAVNSNEETLPNYRIKLHQRKEGYNEEDQEQRVSDASEG